MKIEKVNENQIKCMLTREDLEERQIKLAELAYGSDKAKKLFHEMVQQASEEYDFQVDDMPLMVEAIPGSADSLVLLISKVEYPDELDPRFSRFSDPGEEYFEEGKEESTPASKKGADEIVELFRKMGEKDESEKDTSAEEKVPADLDMVRVFEFSEMEQGIELSKAITDFYRGENSFYKSDRSHYYLLMHKNDHTPQEFNKLCNMCAEFGNEKEFVPSMSAYFEEHSRIIVAKNAIQTLALL